MNLKANIHKIDITLFLRGKVTQGNPHLDLEIIRMKRVYRLEEGLVGIVGNKFHLLEDSED